MKKRNTDFLVLGSGIAGLSYALKVADYGKVLIITKSKLEETNTSLAQGGIAAVIDKLDSYNKHIVDTIDAGAGMCNPEVVKMVVSKAPKLIHDLINWGANFDKDEKGDYDLAKEGGHSEHRILHHKDNTGFEIQRALTERVKSHKNITILENYFAVDFITQHHLNIKVNRKSGNVECYGVYALNRKTKKVETILSKVSFVATGGLGNIYETTTNNEHATGDGIAMVYRAKGIIENMEFIQFHPTSLFNRGERPSFLITEALRGFGAVLKTQDGKEFMQKYDNRESLAPRDIVARAIDNEMKISGTYSVCLDAQNINDEKLKSNFPNIYKKCLSIGIDITKQCIPVVPAAHYSCGGIKVNINGQTSIKYLYASGENASTGLHGANRLASNSLVEAIVFADSAAKHSLQNLGEIKSSIPVWDYSGTSHTEEMILITQNFKELRQIMSNYVGIVRSDLRLYRALRRLVIIFKETEKLYQCSILSDDLCQLRNAVNLSYLIIKMALNRKESIGLHYNIDYPKK